MTQQVVIWFGARFARFLFQKEGPWPIPDPKGWKWYKQSEGDAPKHVSSTYLCAKTSSPLIDLPIEPPYFEGSKNTKHLKSFMSFTLGDNVTRVAALIESILAWPESTNRWMFGYVFKKYKSKWSPEVWKSLVIFVEIRNCDVSYYHVFITFFGVVEIIQLLVVDIYDIIEINE